MISFSVVAAVKALAVLEKSSVHTNQPAARGLFETVLQIDGMLKTSRCQE